MFFKQIKSGPMDNFNYILADMDSKIGAIVDPAFEEQKLFSVAKENDIDIKIVLLTHTHADHIEGLGRVANLVSDLTIYVHKNESSAVSGIKAKIVEVDEGDVVKVGSLKLKVIFTPGHTPGGICYLIDKKIIVGDTLFIGGCGRTDLAGGNTDDLFLSLQKLKNLDENIEVYCGHDYGDTSFATIGHEKKHNPYLLCKNREEFYEIRNG